MKWLFCILFFITPSQAGFIEDLANLNRMRAEVETGEKRIRQLLGRKRLVSDPKEMQRLIKDILIEHKRLSKLAKDYDKNRIRLRTTYPQHNMEIKKSHPRYVFLPLDQLEKEDGVPEMLDRLDKFRVVQYGDVTIDKKINPYSRGNITGEMKVYQKKLKVQQSGIDEWSKRPVLER